MDLLPFIVRLLLVVCPIGIVLFAVSLLPLARSNAKLFAASSVGLGIAQSIATLITFLIAAAVAIFVAFCVTPRGVGAASFDSAHFILTLWTVLAALSSLVINASMITLAGALLEDNNLSFSGWRIAAYTVVFTVVQTAACFGIGYLPNS